MYFVQELDTELSEGRARRIIEVESPEVIGRGYPSPLDPDRVPERLAMTYFDLEKSMNRIWTEARMSYAYGFFQGCTFLVAAVLELLLEQYLRLREVWSKYESKIADPKKRTLGTLIAFCRENAMFEEQVIQSASDINDLRIEAVHMTTEKQEAGTPSDEHPLIEWEENWFTYEKPERNREKGGHMRKNHSNGCRHLWFLWSRVSCPVTHFFSCAVSFFLFC
jgi:hypothetical protein